jgi:hypothetical protein
MKFLIIMRRTPGAANFDNASPDSLEKHADNIRAGLDKGHVHFAAALLSGGGAYVVEADNAKQLAWAIRDNPLYKNCTVEIEPIVDADVFLKAAAKAVKKMKK